MKGAIKARLNHASPEKRTPFKHFVLFLTPQGVFAAPRLSARLKARLTNAFENFDAKSGSFSIKSLYSILEEERVDPFPTSVVWNAWVPPKVSFFPWEVT